MDTSQKLLDLGIFVKRFVYAGVTSRINPDGIQIGFKHGMKGLKKLLLNATCGDGPTDLDPDPGSGCNL